VDVDATAATPAARDVTATWLAIFRARAGRSGAATKVRRYLRAGDETIMKTRGREKKKRRSAVTYIVD
jgi:hypothetical protein